MKQNDIPLEERYHVEEGKLLNRYNEEINPSLACGETFVRASYMLKIINTFELVRKDETR